MWLEIEKEEILSKFSILAEHGFIFEFLTFAKSDTIPMDTNEIIEGELRLWSTVEESAR